VASDLFDFAWEANPKNVALIDAHLAASTHQAKANFFFVAMLILGFWRSVSQSVRHSSF